MAALTSEAGSYERVNFALLGYSITSMETETVPTARVILLGEDASPELPPRHVPRHHGDTSGPTVLHLAHC